MIEIISIVLAYLIGSINTSILLAKIMRQDDPRNSGSGNPGATNALRVQGKKAAIIVLIGDVLKGVLAIWLAKQFALSETMLSLVGFAAVIGHIFPIFFQFRGGKGVATALGVILALQPWAALIALLVWLVVVVISRHVSLGSICAAIAIPISFYFMQSLPSALIMTLMALLIIYKHKSNIKRLIDRRESKIQL